MTDAGPLSHAAIVAFFLVAACSEESPQPVTPLVNAAFNEIVIDPVGKVSWNGQPVSDRQLGALLKRARQLPIQLELRLTPQGTASYEVVDRVMSIAQRAGTTKIGFVGNEAYAPGAEPK